MKLYAKQHRATRIFQQPTITEQLVSIIMPVFNGEEYIEDSINVVSQYLKSYDIPFEIIVVDDGSKDKTYQKAVAAARKYKNVRVVRCPLNRGKGAAFLHGYRYSRGDIVILFDADLDIPPEQITVLLSAMKYADADIVITNKWHPTSRTYASSIRKFLSISWNAIVRLLTGLRIKDTQTGAKAFKREVLEAISHEIYVKRFAFDVELLLLAAKKGFKIVEVPSLKPIRLYSRFRVKEIFNMFLELLSIVYRHGRL